MADDRTIATYNAKASDYADLVATEEPDATLKAFIDLIPTGGYVLDLGCGPGTASLHMKNAGLVPDPVDASEGMIKIAREKYGLEAHVATFDDIEGHAKYDGVWANFSLLHAARDDLPRYFAALAKALKPNGILHVGMKTGDGTARDDIDRLYTYVTVEELKTLFANAGIAVTETKEGVERGMAGTMDPFVIMRGQKG